MAKQKQAAAEDKAPKLVRYQVVAPAFVNGSHIDPQGRKDVFVLAAPGLEGRALKLAPEDPVPAPADGDGGTPGSTPGTDNGGNGSG